MTVLRAFLLAVLPAGIECISGQDNRVAEPLAADYVVMTPTLRGRLGTNVSAYADLTGSGTRRIAQATQLTIQLDVHGPNGADNAQVIATLLRDTAACQAFKASGLDAQPLYATDPRQVPFFNGESQFEDRWIVDAAVQVNPAVTIGQDFAAAIRIGIDSLSVLGLSPLRSLFIVGDAATSSKANAMTYIPHASAGSPYFATTVYGDGTSSTFSIAHMLNTTDVFVTVRDPNDGNAQVPGVDNQAPTPDVVTIILGGPPPAGAPLRIIVSKG